ncbi:hypothetical protein [Streptomyces sp. NPDC089915]|uniref:hypothetical protein n=1 Tax=Streptomyces sp. NPDC089915 TaxID=3155186 RepID=UPI00342E8240
MKKTLTGRTRFAPVIAGFAIAAGITFGGPFIHPPTHDTATASAPAQASAADTARCVFSLKDLVEFAENPAACAPSLKDLPVFGGKVRPGQEPVTDRRETFDWI